MIDINKHINITILGAGESGVGAALLAKSKKNKVFVSDKSIIKSIHKNELSKNKIEFEERQHSIEKILSSDLIIISPGIPNTVDIVKKAEEKRIPIISEIEYASYFFEGKIIAITGSNGKTTTTKLTEHLFINGGKKAIACGNIGKSFARVLFEKPNYYDYAIIELSSFQLERCYALHPYISILLNITPDHLDRYNNNIDEYAKAKMRIIQNQTKNDFFIYNQDDLISNQHINKTKTEVTKIPISIKSLLSKGAYVQSNNIIINLLTETFTMSINDLALQGKHNQYNSMAAGVTAKIEEIRKKNIRDSLMDYKNEPHRMEFIAKIHGVDYINDSKATNVNSTWYALESIENNIIWIAGGQDKGNDYTELTEIVSEKVKAIICLGKENTKIHNSFKGTIEKIYDVKSAFEAVKLAYELSSKNDTVLLSPACASFDLFEDYKDRGEQFTSAVKRL